MQADWITVEDIGFEDHATPGSYGSLDHRSVRLDAASQHVDGVRDSQRMVSYSIAQRLESGEPRAESFGNEITGSIEVRVCLLLMSGRRAFCCN